MTKQFFWAVLGAAFTGHVFYADPSAAEDPLGAARTAVMGFYTSCYREDSTCATMGTLLKGAGTAARFGFDVAQGNGRLVYVANAPTAAPQSLSKLIDQLRQPSSGICSTG